MYEGNNNNDGNIHVTPFEAIRQETKEKMEYWSARDLAKILGYVRWDKFKNAIEKAKVACTQSGHSIEDHFSQTGNMVNLGSKAQRKIEDVKLSRYVLRCLYTIHNLQKSLNRLE